MQDLLAELETIGASHKRIVGRTKRLRHHLTVPPHVIAHLSLAGGVLRLRKEVTQVDCAGFANVDLRFSKFFRIGHGSRAEFIAQLFNIFDRANFSTPATNIGAGNNTTTGRPLFGTSASLLANINAPSRQAEFAVRLQF